MKIVVLQAASLGKNVDLGGLSQFGQVTIYQTTTQNQVPERIKEADIVVINRLKMNQDTLGDAKNIKLITITATGVDCIDLDYTKARGINVANMKDYSTKSVAQHTFALLLCLMEKIGYYNSFVKSGQYSLDTTGAYYDIAYHEIGRKRWGIVGLGNIGKKVASIAEAFDAEIVYYSVSGVKQNTPYEQVDFETLLSTCDIISIHTPLTKRSRDLFDYEAFTKMKRNAVLINVGRGAIVNEYDLVRALEENLIAAAGLDVMEQEPLAQDSPLLKIKDNTRLILTPHVAWASVESRQRSVDEVGYNIEAFLKGIDRNIV